MLGIIQLHYQNYTDYNEFIPHSILNVITYMTLITQVGTCVIEDDGHTSIAPQVCLTLGQLIRVLLHKDTAISEEEARRRHTDELPWWAFLAPSSGAFPARSTAGRPV